MSIGDIRNNYEKAPLLESQLDPDPLMQFDRWMQEAINAGEPQPNAMTLATVSADAMPHARIVLLKAVEAGRFVFYTNYQGDKASQLTTTPHAALVFYWDSLARTIRVEGQVERTDRATTAAYFATRPRGSQLGAWASEQSKTLANRAEMQRQFAETEKRFEGQEVEPPPHWGGYAVTPRSIEFWQGQPSRMHDRLRYTRDDAQASGWLVERLAP